MREKTEERGRSEKTAEPRWPAALAALAVGGLYLSLPEALTLGPDWLLLLLIALLLVPIAVSRRSGLFRVSKTLGYVVLVILTAGLILSLSLLVRSLPGRQLPPQVLLRSATALWVTNILVFASWYWHLDAGGPHARDLRGAHTEGDFLFPQMTLDPERSPLRSKCNWSPGFIDYLFLAFNSSTAFSPTDVPVLSRWAKMLMMVQSTISFATVALLAARAVNIF
jgi:hypothetical protein